MRAVALAESDLRILDPKFQLLETLQTCAPQVLKTAISRSDLRGLDRLQYDALSAADDLPALLGRLLRKLGPDGEGLSRGLPVHEANRDKEGASRSINHLALAVVTVGLYISGALMMQNSVGLRLFGGTPLLAAILIGLALWFTLRLARAISRSQEVD
jgi:ubiquinone biosynthesis protein